MSLQVWLPLNGNINNQGLINWTPTGAEITYVDGKIGKALNTGGIIMPANVTEQVLNNNEFSYCCWLYVNEATGGTAGRPMIFGNSSMTAPNNRRFSLFRYPTCNDLHISWQNDDGNLFIGSVDTGAFPSYKWTHLAVVYKNPNVKIYLNGSLWKKYSGISNSSSFAFDTTLIHNSTYHYLNDIRLYNHALSPKEVKEISKGLCLHYKLSGIGQKNLIDNSFDYSILGFDSNIESDCSGYRNNGTKVGNIIVSADTARYSTSYQLSNGNYITSSTGVPVGDNVIMSINFWYNIPSGETITAFADLFKLGGSNFRTELYGNGQNIGWYNYPIGTTSGISTKISGYDKWDMWTLTNDGTNIKTYLNGKLFKTTPITGTALNTNGSLTIGELKDTIKFKISDFRIYATALSEADILDLYQTGAAIDSCGNIYAYDFIEGGA